MTVVLGTKLDAADRELADAAGRLAARLATPLRLVHVSEDPRAPIVLGTDEEGILGPVRATLRAEAARVQAETGAATQAHLAASAVVDALVQVAELEQASLLVVGGGGRAGQPLLGATAERVARKSATPVLTVREVGRLLAWLDGARPLRVLVGADLGRAASAARSFAARLAAVGPVEVEVVLVAAPAEVHARMGLPPPRAEGALAAEAEDALRRELTRAAPATAGDRLHVIAARAAADVHLVAFAEQHDLDLVVVGQRRRSLLEQLWFGSIARGVLRASPVSVACVPPSVAPRPAFRPPRVVLAATDLSEVGDRAIGQAIGLVVPGGTLHLAHVLGPAPEGARGLQVAREQAWLALGRLVQDELDERGAEVERHVLEGDPADQLLALASRVGADLLVLGARRGSAAANALLGSVALAVTERARVPVLLVPAEPA